MDRGAWQAAVHRVSKSQTQLMQLSMQICDNLATINLKGPSWTRIAFLPFTTVIIRECESDTIQAGIYHVSVNKEMWERNLMKNLNSSEV